MFSLEALTLIFICYANWFVFFLLVHDVSVTEKQLICVQSRVLNLYGVYFSELFASSSFYIHIFSECVLMFRNSSVIFEEYGGSSLFFRHLPLSVYWPCLCQDSFGTICAQEYGTICAQEYGTICAQEYGTICAQEHGTICAQEYGTICAQEHGTICAQEYGTICVQLSWYCELIQGVI